MVKVTFTKGSNQIIGIVGCDLPEGKLAKSLNSSDIVIRLGKDLIYINNNFRRITADLINVSVYTLLESGDSITITQE